MTTVTVGDEFEEKRSVFVVNGPFSGVFSGLFGRDDVHSVDLRRFSKRYKDRTFDPTDLKTGNLIATSKVLGVRRAALGRCSHAILVVFANEDARKIPKFSL